MGIFRRFLQVVGLPGDLETIGKIVTAMLGVAGTTGVWAYFTDGLPWAVFIASGVFLFGVSAFLKVTDAHSQRRLQNKIYVADMGALQWRIPDAANEASIQLLVALNSMATFEIFFEITSTKFTIGGVTGTPDETRTIKGVLAPLGFANLSLASVTTNHKFADGRLALVVKYGREKDQYTHQMDTTLEFFPVAHRPPDEQGYLQLMRNTVALEYKRIKDA